MAQVLLYDTTLRDGMQGQGMSLSATEKVRVAHALDDLGMSFIEAGFPSSNPKEEELFQMLAGESFDNADIVAFGMTRRRDVAAQDDPALQILANSFASVCTLVGKTWDLHLEKVIKVSREDNLAMIADSVAFLRQQGKRVIYDAEHFYDAWASDSAYALLCLRAAVDAGAENITLCDTNGATLPRPVYDATAAVVAAFKADGVSVGVHTHNDAECGVATSLAGVEAGATMVQGTINGYGERTGNANLVSILANLQAKMGYQCVSDQQLASLTETSHLIDEICNVRPNPDQAYVGGNAFAHKGGMHVAGMLEDARTFEHIDPAVVGNVREMVISELSGKGTVQSLARDAGVTLNTEQSAAIVDDVKQREHLGYHYEAAKASFELLIRRASGNFQPLFTLESWRVIVEKHEGGKVQTEATIKVWANGERYVRTAEGNGPVNALDRALRDAIGEFNPHLADIDLVNFKVRILDESKGTGAITRVLLDASDGHQTWGTIGVSENIIEASWEALVEALEYGVQSGREVGPVSSTSEKIN